MSLSSSGAMGALTAPLERIISQTTDVESQPAVSAERDPYDLASRFKSASDLDQINTESVRKRLGKLVVRARPGAKHGPRRGARKVRGFYEKQNSIIERMLKSVEEHRADARRDQASDQLKFRIAVYGSLAANVVLAAVQVYAAISSGSISLFATMVDAVFDPLSSLILILSSRAIRRVDPLRFPAGKARLETVGNIIFCFLMTSVSLVIIALAAQDLVQRQTDKGFHLAPIVSVCAAFATKLGLFFYCWSIKNRYSQVKILWKDHRNDLFVNGFGVMTALAGAQFAWWIDPAGAIVLSSVISAVWLHTSFGECMLLVGVVPSAETQQQLTYLCLTHSPSIRKMDTMRAYYSGPRLIVEVDVVMDPLCTLMETHDLAEGLQSKLESLPEVERAYVHIDYETSHKPEHGYVKEM
ncbi:hypothetical protein L249_8151 [Ophiocordyceps polyrhachis-furcata BCC 54312]|uniref:Uncharacterized protein n=1 Tax=Ophiocordyceps polyrhachis-furcata BCC 54312 TaxID=1330021 RepID=A0A367LH40_9HYPO|nr:hypothetical protein L249_8151 [Ophiocordyceps polyrhachis-furcata BCC 54312]